MTNLFQMNSLSSNPYKGTRDYYPDDKRVQNYIFESWHKVAKRYGYEEYGAPVLEPLDIYLAKSGQELAGQQTYTFTDRGDRQVAIRPEMTPSISRLVAGRRQELAYPARLYSVANFMRYERPQKGREREFWQLNVDVFGDDSNYAEIEIIKMAVDIMSEFGANSDTYTIRLNDRRLVDSLMRDYLALDADKALATTKMLDRRAKISSEDFAAQAQEIVGSEETLQKLLDLVELKTIDDLPEEIVASQPAQDLKSLLETLRSSGTDNIIFDVTLMRGLDYYTGTVFEIFDNNQENNRSLFGGGRYDGLVEQFGVEPVSAVGMAPGATVLEEFIKLHDLLPETKSYTDIYVATIGDCYPEASHLVETLRQEGLNIEFDSTDRKPEQKIKSASKKQISQVLFVGQKELESGVFSVKNIGSGQEKQLDIKSIPEYIKVS